MLHLTLNALTFKISTSIPIKQAVYEVVQVVQSSLLFSCCGGGILHLLAAVPQPAPDVRGGDPVRGVDPPTAAGPARPLHGFWSVLLLQFHTQPHSLHDHVQEVPEGLQ